MSLSCGPPPLPPRVSAAKSLDEVAAVDLTSLSVVAKFEYRNTYPERKWGDDGLEIDLTHGLVNFISGRTGLETGFQGRAPVSGISKLRVLREGPDVPVDEVLPTNFEMTYRYCVHGDGCDPYQFPWVHRLVSKLGVKGGSFTATKFWTYCADNRTIDREGAMAMTMNYEGCFLKSSKPSKTQHVFVKPLPASNVMEYLAEMASEGRH